MHKDFIDLVEADYLSEQAALEAALALPDSWS
jgi:hypothetical protein